MRLSTAMRIGSMTTKQIKGAISDGGNGRCAIGAALDAVGVSSEMMLTLWCTLICRHFGISPEFRNAIWKLNDGYNWSREQIAGWIECVENLQERKYKRTEVLQNAIA